MTSSDFALAIAIKQKLLDHSKRVTQLLPHGSLKAVKNTHVTRRTKCRLKIDMLIYLEVHLDKLLKSFQSTASPGMVHWQVLPKQSKSGGSTVTSALGWAALPDLSYKESPECECTVGYLSCISSSSLHFKNWFA